MAQSNLVHSARGAGGGSGSGLTTEQEAIVNAFEHGQQVVEIPIDIGHRPSSGFAAASWNNDLMGIRYGKNDLGGSSPSSSDNNGSWIFSTQTPAGYTGGDIICRVNYSLSYSGEAGDTADFRLQLAQLAHGGQLPDAYDFTYHNVVDLEGVSWNTLQTFDFIIPEADWTQVSDRTFFDLTRVIYNNADDTYANQVYVHGFELLFDGYGLKSSPSAP